MITYIISGVIAAIGVATLVYVFFIREQQSEDYSAYGYLIVGAVLTVGGACYGLVTWIMDKFF